MTVKLPFFKSIQAGHPDFCEELTQEGFVNLNKLLVKSKSQCFFILVESNGYEDFGFEHGDLLVMHKSMTLSVSDVVLNITKGSCSLSFYKHNINPSKVDAVVTAVIKFKKDLMPSSFQRSGIERGALCYDLNAIIKDPNHSSLLEVEGESMFEAGIEPGNLVLTNSGIEPKSQDIVVARLHGGFTLKHYNPDYFSPKLQAANKAFADIDIPYDEDFKVVSVVTAVIQIRKKI